MTFRIQEYLEERDVEYKTEGKNVTAGWTEISCYSCQDPSFHLGISPDGLYYNCWVCGEKGHITNLIKEIEDCNYSQAKNILKEFSDDFEIERQERQPGETIKIPTLLKEPLKIQRNYLKKRNFDIDHLIEEYGIGFFPQIGKYNFCIYVPIIMNNQVVSFVACDVTGKKELKYDMLSIEESLINPKHCLYNIDSVKNYMFIVEGITDVWRMGVGTVGTLGSKFTMEQVELMVSKKCDKYFAMFDPDAMDESLKLMNELSGLVDIEILELTDGDPADLTNDEVIRIKRGLL